MKWKSKCGLPKPRHRRSNTEHDRYRFGWPCKVRDGKFAFLCPHCHETESAVNPRTNLERCLHCETNFNPIDFTISAWQCDFLAAVDHLTALLPRIA